MNKGIVLVQVGDNPLEYELEIPLDVKVKTISKSILKALKMEGIKEIKGYYIKTENPTCFLKGNDFLSDYGISSGSKIILI
ncbi:EsaB/YukD family protein [Clostridium paraputrificum]|uniref:EsaB/YukD family protein n=1 Tax=Clostridium paraputrificum TaxID=29363 RepID=UPI003D3567D6